MDWLPFPDLAHQPGFGPDALSLNGEAGEIRLEEIVPPPTIFFCGSCHADTPHTWLDLYKRNHLCGGESVHRLEYVKFVGLYQGRCTQCDNTLLWLKGTKIHPNEDE